MGANKCLTGANAFAEWKRANGIVADRSAAASRAFDMYCGNTLAADFALANQDAASKQGKSGG